MRSGRRLLIVNADDFGRSAGVNRGVVEAHERGIVTSASLMVLESGAAEAAALARAHPRLGVGLHVVLRTREDQVEAQLARFRALLGRDPTHLDSHRHVHMNEPARSALLESAENLRVPLRHFSPIVACRDDFYGKPDREAISTGALLSLLRSLHAGVTELVCHPGYGGGLDSSYRLEREHELETLCDPNVRAAVTELGIELVSFADLAQDRAD